MTFPVKPATIASLPPRTAGHSSGITLAVLDAGTHALRGLLAGVSPDGTCRPIEEFRIPTGMGRGLSRSGIIGPQSEKAFLHAVETIVRLVAPYQPALIQLFATSAFRNAANGPDILEHVRSRFGIPVFLLSGEEEARLSFLAASLRLGSDRDRFGVLDVGGGSVEVGTGTADGPEILLSMDLGAVYLTERFKTADPIGPSQMNRMERHIRSTFRKALGGRRWAVVPVVVGTGGTLATIFAFFRAKQRLLSPLHRMTLSRRTIASLSASLSALPTEELLRLPGILPDRAPYVAAGCCVVRILMDELGAGQLMLNETGLREGLLIRCIRMAYGLEPRPGTGAGA